MENAPLLELRNIKKDFFGNRVLTDINLKLEEGEVLGLVGENGAGKSTLMKILFGETVIAATGGYGGEIFLNGKKVSFTSPFEAIENGIGMVHQEFSLIPGFDATENILLNREPRTWNPVSEVFGDRLDVLNRKKMDEQAEAAIEKMGVSIDRHMTISTMPVGHKQFTEIARELSKDQLKLLILDEPTAVLTEHEAEALLDSIRGMSARGIAVIFITHRLHEILSVCNRVAVMRDGVLVQEVDAKETNVDQITRWMVGRTKSGAADQAGQEKTAGDARRNTSAPTGNGAAEAAAVAAQPGNGDAEAASAAAQTGSGAAESAAATARTAAAAQSAQNDSAAQPASSRVILKIEKLWVDMPGETVRNVSLDVREGEILGIGGLAGQGKLGIPNGIMGLCEAGGRVVFDGQEIPLNNPRKCLDSSFAFVSEDRRGVGLLLDESLEWNVAFPAMQVQNKFLKSYLGGLIQWRDEDAIREVTEKYIEELQIKCTGSRQNARELSGGNQQKVCLAKAFALEPRVLFVSEPTRGIDVGAKALVLEALKKFNREKNVTVVMISSELEELRSTCDRIAIVSGGRVSGILPAGASVEEFGRLMLNSVI